MRLFLKIIGGLAVLLMIALAIFISTFDVNKYKDDIMQIVRDQTGRDFDVDGDFKLGLSLLPTIKVEQVKLGNAKWGSVPDMIKVKSFEMELDLIPLLSGNVKISQLVLDTADILLETNKEGIGNWVFDVGRKNTEAGKKQISSDSGLASVNINEINIKNSGLTYKDGKTGKSTRVKIDEFVVESSTFSQSLDIVLKAVYNDISVSIYGSVGSLARLTENKKIPLDITTQISDAVLKIKGTVAEPMSMQGADLDLDFKASSLTPFAKIIEKELPDIGAVELIGHISEKKGKYKLDAVNAQALETQFTVDGQVSINKPLEGFDLNIKLETDSLVNFNKIKDLTGREFPALGPLYLKGHISEKDGFYQLDTFNVNLEKDLVLLNGKLTAQNPLQGFDLEIKLNVENLAKFNSLTGQTLPDAGPLLVNGHISEKDGIYLFKDVNVELPKSKLSIDGKLTDLIKTDGSDLNINFQSTSLAELNGFIGNELPALGSVSLIANVSDRNGSYHLQDMTFKADKTDLIGNIIINIKGERPALTATVKSDLIDLTPFESDKKEEENVKKNKVFSSEPLPLDNLKAVDVDLDIKANRIKTTDLTLGNVILNLKLNNGNLTISKLNTNVGGGTLVMSMRLDASNSKSGNLNTNIDLINFQPSTMPDLKDKISGASTDLIIKANGSGGSVAEIMAGLNGNVLLTLGEGDIKSDKFGLLDAEILSSTLNILNPVSSKDKDRKLICGVVNFDITEGIAKIDKGIAISMQRMDIVGSGIIDLKTEELNIAVKPKTKGGIGISVGNMAELVKITGTLTEPEITPDTIAAFKTAASIGAAVATVGISLLAQRLFSKATEDVEPCATALGIKPESTTTTTTKTEE